MGDPTKTFEVVVTVANGQRESRTVHAGSVSFTMTGDLIFEDETRNFQEVYAKGHWLSVHIVQESN